MVPRAHILAFHHDFPACCSRLQRGKGPCFMVSQWSLLRDHPKSTGSSSREPEFSSQHPNSSAQTSVIPVPDDPTPSPGLHRYCAHVYRHICRQKWQNTHTHKNKFKKDYPKEHDKLCQKRSSPPLHSGRVTLGTHLFHVLSGSGKAWCMPYGP